MNNGEERVTSVISMIGIIEMYYVKTLSTNYIRYLKQSY